MRAPRYAPDRDLQPDMTPPDHGDGFSCECCDQWVSEMDDEYEKIGGKLYCKVCADMLEEE